MATYQELYDFSGTNELLNKIAVAVAIAADTVLNEDAGTINHANRLVWAKLAFESPQTLSKSFIYAVLAANKSATIQQITNSTDEQIQTAVDSVVNLFAGA